MKRLSKQNRAVAERTLETVASIQTLYWEILRDLEELLGCEINANVDLMGVSVDDLRRGDGNR